MTLPCRNRGCLAPLNSMGHCVVHFYESLKHGEHAARINHERTMIVGCTCGWRTPPGAENSDTACAEHIARARVLEGAER